MNLAHLADQSLERFGDRPSVLYEGRWYRSAEWAADGRRAANALASLGVGPGDRVAVMMPNDIPVFQTIGGTLASGAVVLPIIFLLAPPEIRHIVEDAGPRVFVTSPLFLDKVTEALDGMEEPPRILVAGGPAPEGAGSFDELLAEASPDFSIVERDEDDVAVIMYTGGTTGRPKGVELTHGNLYWNAVTVADAVRLTRDSVSLLCLPVAHLFGLFAGIIGQVLGLRGVMLEWFTPDETLQAIQDHRVSYTAMVPTMLTMLLHHPTADDYDTSSLETVFVSAAPVPVELAEAFEKRFDCQVLEAYGQTEAAPAIALNPPGAMRKAGSTGMPLPGCEVRILDEEDRPLPAGEVGEIVARSPGVMRGYRNLPEETDAALRGGWLHTGDMGYLDEDGYLFVTDRKRDLIIRGGENVFPRDVEDALIEHVAVAEVAVVGRPDPRLGEEVVAFVVKSSGAEVTEEELMEHVRERLARYKSPKEVRFVPELPKSPIGKVLKKDLREMLLTL